MATLALCGLSLASCGPKTYALEDYVQDLALFKDKDEIKVMQLTDLHANFATDFPKQKAFWGSLIQAAKPSLIMLTGDNVLNASKHTVTSLLDTFNELCEENDCYFGLIWGNHDKEGTYDPAYWLGESKKRSRSVYRELPGDNIYGRSNYVLNLTDGANTYWQVYALDSNSLISKNPLKFTYDILHEDQVKWFAEESDLAAKKDGEGHIISYVPSLVYFHIPLWELEYAYRLAGLNPDVSEAPGTLFGYSGEEREAPFDSTDLGKTQSWVGYKNSGFFEVAEQKGTRGIFWGHDHKSNFVAKYASAKNYRDASNAIVMGYGLKSSCDLSYLADMTGATVSTIKKDGSVSYSRYYQTYQDNYETGTPIRVEEMGL